MKHFSRRNALAAILVLPFAGGCASDACNRLAFDEKPKMAASLVVPEGVRAIAEGGQFRVPEVSEASPVKGCQARPPMTLPPDVLEEPEENEA